MSSYINEIAAKTTEWSFPIFPALGDPSWQRLFDEGTAQVKRNLAHAWLWAVHMSMQDIRAELQPGASVRLVMAHPRWFREITPFIDVEKTRAAGLVFDGSFDKLFNIGIRGEDMTNPDKHLFRHLLKQTWLGSVAEQEEALPQMVNLLVNCLSGATEAGDLKKLASCIAWDCALASRANMAGFDLAIELSVGLADNEVQVPTGANPVHKAFHALALHSIHPDLTGTLDKEELAVQENLSKIPPGALAKGVLDIFYTMADVNDRKWLSNPSNPFFDWPYKNPTVFEALNYWVPSLESTWDTAQAIGMSDTEAVEQARTNLATTISSNPDLPDNMLEHMPTSPGE